LGSVTREAVQEVTVIAQAVADEIKAAFDAHKGRKWTTVGLDLRPLPLDVYCPTLADKTVDELEKASSGDVGCFSHRLSSAGSSYVNGRNTGGTLLSIVVDELEVIDDAYTGNVTVHERSIDYD
jgi:hypothetical protein